MSVADPSVLSRIRKRLRSRRIPSIHPHPGPTHGSDEPVGLVGKSGALRAAIFGVNDGWGSNLSLIMGVTGANVSNKFILLAGVAGLLVGAFSIGRAPYVTMRLQREQFERITRSET